MRALIFSLIGALTLYPLSLKAETPTTQISKDSQYRYIKTNTIPNHKTGQFPNSGNPNSISAQQ